MLVKAVREGLGRVIVLADYLTRPRRLRRAPEQQAVAEASARSLSLYQFYACPFCVKTRRTIHRLNIPVELRDAQNDARHRHALRNGGGEIKVPCLRIDEEDRTVWLYESSQIIEYLNDRFDPAGQANVERAS